MTQAKSIDVLALKPNPRAIKTGAMKMDNSAHKTALRLLRGWLTCIKQQNKAIRRKNRLIKRLRKELDDRNN